MRDRPLLLATRSAGKLRELRPLFERSGYRPVSLDDLDIPEDEAEQAVERFATFEENALAKARYFFEVSGGMTCVADDSGLEVAVLGGQPGVRSKRWSGRDDLAGEALDAANNAKLLASLRGASDLRARYVCAAACAGLGGRELLAHGATSGTIVRAPRGDGGFGYDPYFLSEELGLTFGEASASEKERVSHRGRAFRELLRQLSAVAQ
jgi:XTP/dITP diphosphohydrolase